jgi:hypothetical protein
VLYDQGVIGARLRNRLALRARMRQMIAPIRGLLDRARGRTSVTDEGSYTKLCDEAARDPAVFASFKTHPSYTPVLEHVTCEEGSDYLRIALDKTPALGAQFERFRENDRLGAPQTCDYGEHGRFSPTTLRYVKVLSDMTTLFGSLDGLRIVEIGCGYGGQCFITNVAFEPQSYTLIDLEPCLRLQKTYLDKLGVSRARFVTAGRVSDDDEYDLVVSNYAFSECVRAVQEEYLTRILQRTGRGYLTCNWISPRQFRSLTPDELLDAIPGSEFLPEVPRTAPANRVWVWGSSDAPVTSELATNGREDDRRATP